MNKLGLIVSVWLTRNPRIQVRLIPIHDKGASSIPFKAPFKLSSDSIRQNALSQFPTRSALILDLPNPDF